MSDELRGIKEEEKKLYEDYKRKLNELRKIKYENEAVGQVFTKGLLPIYTLYILTLGPTNGNDISQQIGKRTNGFWIPSTGGIYPLLKKLEKQGFVEGIWDSSKKSQKVYTITEVGLKEFETKRILLQQNVEEALEVFKIIIEDLYG
ncbi:MAG: PadR family transcriptional regulator [Clostridium sp.]|uniref:PadR family transcriptional regulator n=1 Tax=Clostridium sp. TaxID=1506 RepID=UPI00306A3861